MLKCISSVTPDMLMKGFLVLILCIGTYGTRYRQRNGCRDRMLHIADGKYPCRMLVDPNHRHQGTVGAYANREALCMGPRYSGCCRTCMDHRIITDVDVPIKNRTDIPKINTTTPIYRNTTADTCQDRMLQIADGKYPCSMLIDRQHRHQKSVGAYKYRKMLCSSNGFSGCCKTCTENNLVVRNSRRRIQRPKPQPKPKVIITNGVEIDRRCKDSGLLIAGGSYSCNLLVDQHDRQQSYIGAYKHREKLCNYTGYSGCCRTCVVHGITEFKLKPSKQKIPQKEPNRNEDIKLKHQPPSYCQDSSLRIADGGYECSMLIDRNHRQQAVVGAFKNRRKICSRAGFSGCCFTCQRHVIGKSRRNCKDKYVVVRKNKQTYACRELLQKKSDIYPDRFNLCADPVNTKCCKTCAKVSKTKSKNGLAKNTNLISKPKLVEVFAVEEVESSPGGLKPTDMHKAFKMMHQLLQRLMTYANSHPNDLQSAV